MYEQNQQTLFGDFPFHTDVSGAAAALWSLLQSSAVDCKSETKHHE